MYYLSSNNNYIIGIKRKFRLTISSFLQHTSLNKTVLKTFHIDGLLKEASKRKNVQPIIL